MSGEAIRNNLNPFSKLSDDLFGIVAAFLKKNEDQAVDFILYVIKLCSRMVTLESVVTIVEISHEEAEEKPHKFISNNSKDLVHLVNSYRRLLSGYESFKDDEIKICMFTIAFKKKLAIAYRILKIDDIGDTISQNFDKIYKSLFNPNIDQVINLLKPVEDISAKIVSKAGPLDPKIRGRGNGLVRQLSALIKNSTAVENMINAIKTKHVDVGKLGSYGGEKCNALYSSAGAFGFNYLFLLLVLSFFT